MVDGLQKIVEPLHISIPIQKMVGGKMIFWVGSSEICRGSTIFCRPSTIFENALTVFETKTKINDKISRLHNGWGQFGGVWPVAG